MSTAFLSRIVRRPRTPSPPRESCHVPFRCGRHQLGNVTGQPGRNHLDGRRGDVTAVVRVGEGDPTDRVPGPVP